MATALMIYLILAVLSRVAPQMNLFAIGFAVIIPAGLVVLFWEVPELMMVFVDTFEQVPAMMRNLMLLGRQR
jgi:flagellar biosynthetic protein FliR